MEPADLPERPDPAAHQWLLWGAFFTGPVTFLVHHQLGYSLVPWFCGSGYTLLEHSLAVVSIAICALAALLALRSWRSQSKEWSELPESGHSPSTFLALTAAGLNALAGLVIAGQWLAIGLFNPCER